MTDRRMKTFQVAGEASRIPADKLRGAMRQSRSLEKAFLKFAHSFMNQTANIALSNATATIEERLARWLLMANDRLDGDEIPGAACRCHGRPKLSGTQGSHSAVTKTDRHDRPKGTQG